MEFKASFPADRPPENGYPLVTLTFPTADGRPTVYRTAAVACPDVACPCTVVHLRVLEIDAPAEPKAFGALGSRISLDVLRRSHNIADTAAPAVLRLARTIGKELQPDHWVWLGEYFKTSKRRDLETMDTDKVQVTFPPDILANPSLLVSYSTLFPWADQLQFQRGTERWLVNEQYCSKPGCECTDVMLAFYFLEKTQPDGARWQPLDPELRGSIVRDYRKHVVKGDDRLKGGAFARALVPPLLETHPELDARLRTRHGQIQRLGLRAHASDSETTRKAPEPVRRESPKVGRNDPCPCGSGRKFKQCCGRTP